MKKKELLKRIEALEARVNIPTLEAAKIDVTKHIIKHIERHISEEPKETFMGFEVREYNGEIVEVANSDGDWLIERLVNIRDHGEYRVQCEWSCYSQVRIVPKDKQNFA